MGLPLPSLCCKAWRLRDSVEMAQTRVSTKMPGEGGGGGGERRGAPWEGGPNMSCMLWNSLPNVITFQN